MLTYIKMLSIFKKEKIKPQKSILQYYDEESYRNIEFRRLAKNVRRFGNPKEIRSFIVTSATKKEGKSLIASNLAIAVAKLEKDKNVLLIDCDLRRPRIHSLFNLSRRYGLSQVLDEALAIEDVIQGTELGNLSIITSGSNISSPLIILSKIKDIINKALERFDIVICDAPPVVPIDDVSMITSAVDGVLVVVMAGRTDKMAVKRAIDILKENEANILGIVLNDIHGSLPYYYDYKYYGYRYERY